MMTSPRLHVATVALAIAIAIAPAAASAGEVLDLSGVWQLRLDAQDEGMRANWPAAPLDTTSQITLPNTTDCAGFGFPLDTNTMRHGCPAPVTTRFPGVKEAARADEQGYLVRRMLFVGPAWYERAIQIPADWRGRTAVLHLERAMWQTRAWVDGREAGSCDSLVAPHRLELGTLPPGPHRLTLRVDNRLVHNLSTITHAYGPETQTRWNGLIGSLRIEAANSLSLRTLAVHPTADRRSARVVVTLTNAASKPVRAQFRARLLPAAKDEPLGEAKTQLTVTPGLATHTMTVLLSHPAEPWDEFSPVRYRCQLSLEADGNPREERTVQFGFRHIERAGKELRLNGRPLFLRGTLDCAVYPRTGHPPMTVPEWEEVLSTIKSHGFNHVRYHTWCPPEAAFEAADRLGLYLEAEAPAWVDDWGIGTATRPLGIGRDPQVEDYLRAELRRMSEAYGNHPSFLLCVIGNEFGQQHTDWPRVNKLVEEIKDLDPRRLYSGCTARRRLEADEFWVTHHSGASTRGVGPAHTDWDFRKAVDTSPAPLISHETGQRPVFPDYDTLLPKFTGPLLPLNLERYRRALIASGLGDQAQDFVRASARFQLAQYKAEHEGMLRTRGLAGYQLLMLNDFTGQSEALVGVLDPFWESKGVVNTEDVRAWNAPTVILARFPKFTWTTRETFTAKIEVAHFGPTNLPSDSLSWALATRSGRPIAQQTQPTPRLPTGAVSPIGEISVSLDSLRQPEALQLEIRGFGAQNRWNLWVYPAGDDDPEPPGVRITRALDDAALQSLRDGGRVLWLANGLKNAHAAKTGFESVYWSAGWWGNKFSSLGVLCDPKHPALADFPNQGWSDWQWRELCVGATTFHLEGAPKGFRPVVQAVPDFHFPALLAHLFEARVEKGALIVCGYDLASDLDRRPAARQLRRSLLRYMAGPAFRPTHELSPNWLDRTFAPAGLQRRGARVLEVDSEDRANGNVAANLIDGDPATFWHTRWQPRNDPLPHHVVLDLGRAWTCKGITCLPRQDQANGRIADTEVFCSVDNRSWGSKVASARWSNTEQLQTLLFAQPMKVRYLKLVANSEVLGQPFASLAEIDLLTEDK